MLKSSETIDDDRIMAKCYVELGDVTKEKGEYDESLRYHRKSLEIFERIADSLSAADSHLNIAAVYRAKGELKQAMTEYEKGLTLYEDVFVDDAYKNNDSGTDVSLNSSSFSDIQHAKSISKSDETLPQTTTANIIEKNNELLSSVSLSNNGLMNGSTSALNLLVSSTKTTNDLKNLSPLIADLKSHSSSISERVGNKLIKSLSSSYSSDLHSIDDTDILLPSPSSDPVYETKAEDLFEENNIYQPSFPYKKFINLDNPDLSSEQTNQSSLDTKEDEICNFHQQNSVNETNVSNNETDIGPGWGLYHRLLIVFIAITLTSAMLWSHNNSSIKNLLLHSATNLPVQNNIQHYSSDDLYEQLRKILPWRKEHIKSMSIFNRRTIEEFLNDSENRTRTTIDKFQKMLDMLDLKVVLIPR